MKTSPKNFTLIDVLALLTLAALAVYFSTRTFNQEKEIDRLSEQNIHLGEELNETKLKLDYYQRGVNDSH